MTSPQPTDLTNCDREPIHIPGSIQPHGSLLACDIGAGTIQRHSLNAPDMLGFAGDLNGHSLSDVLGSELAHSVRNALARNQEGSRAALLFNQQTPNGRNFDIAVHRFKGAAIVEFEVARGFAAEPLDLARTMIGRIGAIATTEKLVRDTARLIQAMLGYDRVMVYQFGVDGAGKVISEAKRPDLESFLGQYFPATDIPQQARTLYLKNTIRIISDASFQPVPVRPVLDASGEPLDLSFAHLRSVSPIHCEYLRNMGVGASMSISIIVGGALWGLITCHHYSPRTLSMAERVAAEMFGEFFSLHLEALRHQQALEVATTARARLDQMLRDTSRTENINETLRGRIADFATLIPSDGQGIWLDGEWTAAGLTPPPGAVATLTRFAATVCEGNVWATNHLSSRIAEAQEYDAEAAGVMIVPLSQRPRDYLFFFRREVVQTLDWAGNPDKTYESGPMGDRLTPRKSFAIWKETVRGQSEPWTDAQRALAEATRVALVEIVLQNNELLADERAKAEVRQRVLNDELNHRVKNILAVIKSLVGFPASAGVTLEEYVFSLRGRIQALSFAHDQVTRGEGGGPLAGLLKAELSPYQAQSKHIALDGPNVWLDARAFSVMALVLHELSTNAAKYGALSNPSGQLKVQWTVDAFGACDILWTESSGPTVRPPSRRGFGTVLIDRSVPFDLGGESDVQYLPAGVVARFRLPHRFVSVPQLASNVPAKTTEPTAGPRVDLAGRTVLVVEDQMLIAIDLEEMLMEAGLTVVATCSSSADALAALKKTLPDIAVLDVNLGADTSIAVATALAARGVPFIFATGYGESSIIPPELADAPVVRKPYEAATIVGQIRKTLAPG